MIWRLGRDFVPSQVGASGTGSTRLDGSFPHHQLQGYDFSMLHYGGLRIRAHMSYLVVLTASWAVISCIRVIPTPLDERRLTVRTCDL